MKGTLAQELDFINEGKNSERCQNDLKHLGYVYVPKVLWNLTSTVSMDLCSFCNLGSAPLTTQF